ncbi:MAG: lysine--tRNA ligase [Desulfobacterota bacterium]|nr:lysine--tRNA ligase [Thermodesulfobacteriota bacterium]
MNDQREFLKHRLQKLRDLRAAGINPFANTFKPRHTAHDVRTRMEGKTKEEIEGCTDVFSLAGRIMSLRDFGKSSFFHIQDRTGKVQAYIQKNKIGENRYALFKKIDIGDFIGVCGRAFLTHSGELTILVDDFTLLTKSLRPLPEKWHGLQDIETRYRQRYLDLIVNESVRATFQTRSQIIALVREFLVSRDFLEVETPMMQPIAGGAAAQPFITHHNALDMDLYLRIAPELYLKRLLVGGFERVFEINRNFRNEGISTQHNPEFTMLEFYCAYATYEDLMHLTEDMFCFLCRELFGSFSVTYQGTVLDFTPPWKRMTLKEAAAVYAEQQPSALDDPAHARAVASRYGVVLSGSESHGEVLTALFEATAERHLIQPTFITHYPVEVSPLARANEDDPTVTDRFELYVAGREIANAFSELTDPEDQRRRFVAQAEAKARLTGDPVVIDEDFLLALEHGMPPAAGEGIGIDRLVMLLTDAASIRDVILFPLFRAERS